jgi:hypothetical protein
MSMSLRVLLDNSVLPGNSTVCPQIQNDAELAPAAEQQAPRGLIHPSFTPEAEGYQAEDYSQQTQVQTREGCICAQRFQKQVQAGDDGNRYQEQRPPSPPPNRRAHNQQPGAEQKADGDNE